MLLTVEGGGFFSSSASGFSKGLALLLLGQNHDVKPMKVSPWNHYRLVEREPVPDLQLASVKKQPSPGPGCASFVCFGRTSAGFDTSSSFRVGSVEQQDVFPGSIFSDEINDIATQLDDGETDLRKVILKSNMKKRSNTIPVHLEDINEHEGPVEKNGDVPSHGERKKVHWSDACGSELAEIREFEPSETHGSDDEFDGKERTCSCTIM